MTEKAQRIAIAEARGWHRVWNYNRTLVLLCPPSYKVGENNETDCPTDAPITEMDGCHIPDYLNDLDAMHEAEKKLTDDEWQGPFLTILQGILRLPGNILLTIRRATAAQRAEAFLKTLNLWTE